MSLQSRISDLITAIGADIKDLRAARAFRVYLANDAAYGDGATIMFNNKSGPVGDPQNWFDTGTGRFQPTKPGYYHLSAALGVSSGMSSGQYVEIRLYKNGFLASQGSRGYWSGTSTQANSIVSDVFYFNGTTDYAYCTHAASTARNDTLIGQSYATFFTGTYVGANSGTPDATPIALVTRARKTTDTVLATGWNGPVSFPTEDGDTLNAWNGSRFQPTIPGWYRVGTSIFASAMASGTLLEAHISKNATGTSDADAKTVAADLRPARSDGWASPKVDEPVYLNGTTDYLEVFTWCSGNYTIRGTSTGPSLFTAEFIGK